MKARAVCLTLLLAFGALVILPAASAGDNCHFPRTPQLDDACNGAFDCVEHLLQRDLPPEGCSG